MLQIFQMLSKCYPRNTNYKEDYRCQYNFNPINIVDL